LIKASVAIRVSPAGATMRLHQLPKESRYALIGNDGTVTRRSGTTRSDAREK